MGSTISEIVVRNSAGNGLIRVNSNETNLRLACESRCCQDRRRGVTANLIDCGCAR